jgi:alkanesulfonate monooxygenase SsuD/methylene tetrahydromethanopterin reductase-like flavin-dependent oxidoreductase (luciferase family)
MTHEHATPRTATQPTLGLELDDEAALQIVVPTPTNGGAIARSALADLVEHGVAFVVIGRARSSLRRIDATVAASALARLHPGLGVVIAAVPGRDHPYNLARRILSVDHLTAGFAGLVVESTSAPVPSGSLSAADTAEYVDLVSTLWNTFPREALVGDQTSGLFARSEQIVRPEHEGRWRVSGPLTTPSSVQGTPPVLHWGPKPAQSADLKADVFVLTPSEAHADAEAELGAAKVVFVHTSPSELARELDEHRSGVILALGADDWLPAVAALESAQVGERPPAGATLRDALGLPTRAVDVSGLTPAFAPAEAAPPLTIAAEPSAARTPTHTGTRA